MGGFAGTVESLTEPGHAAGGGGGMPAEEAEVVFRATGLYVAGELLLLTL